MYSVYSNNLIAINLMTIKITAKLHFLFGTAKWNIVYRTLYGGRRKLGYYRPAFFIHFADKFSNFFNVKSSGLLSKNFSKTAQNTGFAFSTCEKSVTDDFNFKWSGLPKIE